jgi:hypothetical protein
MQRQQTGRLAGIILALLACLGAIAWAQGGDTPIVILDGSLSIESQVPWSQFTGTGDQRSHPNAGKSITKVVVTMPDKNQTITFNKQSCLVDVTYGGDHIRVESNGRGLRLSPFSAFVAGDTPNRLRHRRQEFKISHVTVTRNGASVFDSDAKGGTKITISYE